MSAPLKSNDPCWCGSGRKYKRCHMLTDAQGRQPRPPKPERRRVKTPEEIAGMRRAGAANGELMDYIRPFVKVGVATAELDRLVHEWTVARGYVPACLGYHGFPRSCCISLNDVVCHGIPSEGQVIKAGDIVNVDLTTIVDGFYGDSSETFLIGEVTAEARHLVEVAARCMMRGIAAVTPGESLKTVAAAIEPYARSQGCSVVQQYTGHGIGRQFHEHFTVYHHQAPDADRVIMHPGITFTVEPMINQGDWRVTTDPVDSWTVRTADGSLSAQFEHTVLVTEQGVEALTLTPRQRAAGRMAIIDGLDLG
jgi:methionyl aminopeptidase